MKTLRERHLFRDSGRALVVAMDHARSFDTVTSLKDSNKVITDVIEGGADAILAPYGTALHAVDVLGAAGLWLSIDCYWCINGKVVVNWYCISISSTCDNS